MHYGELIFKRVRELSQEGKMPSAIHYEVAADRLKYGLKNGEMPLKDGANDEDALIFIAERQLLATANHPYITNRTAIAYAKSLAHHLPIEEIENTASLIGISWKRIDNNYKLRIEDFLRYAPNSEDYKLFYFEIAEGWIKVDKRKFIRIVEEAIKKILSQQPRGSFEEAKPYISVLLEAVPKKKVIVRSSGKMPPCIKDLIERLKNHENLSHYARWSLAVYLINSGMDTEQIVELYKALPDFKEEITRYQVEHIKKKGYKMPSCAKMRSLGLCVAQCNVKNPMDYGREHEKTHR